MGAFDTDELLGEIAELRADLEEAQAALKKQERAKNPPQSPSGPPGELRGNSRRLAKDRYDRALSGQLLAVRLSAEVERLVTAGRVPWNVAIDGLGIAIAEFETRLAEESLSWARDFAPCHGGDRARMDDE